MRVLIANDGIADAGGVDTYLRSITSRLRLSGCETAFLHTTASTSDTATPCDRVFNASAVELDPVLTAIAGWSPDVCFSHNMARLDVEEQLVARWPVVKMMHGYFGTCVSGQKTRLFPAPRACSRNLGAGCLAHYLPRRCGALSIGRMLSQFDWARRQRALLPRYAAVVVASRHMRDEFVRHGVPTERVHAVPLFAPPDGAARDRAGAVACDVLFLGRMTRLKGGDLLVRAVRHASDMLQRSLTLVMAGDGPERNAWESLARGEKVAATFTGWVNASTKTQLCAAARVLAVPSIWPEPFGLVGLEAAAAGLPAVARDTGGIREWLRHENNGLLVSGPPDARRFADAIARVLSDAPLQERLARGALNVARQMSLGAHVDALLRDVLRPSVAARTAR